MTKLPAAYEVKTGRILIADDEVDLAESVAYPLRKRGYQVDIFRAGMQAAGQALTRPYNLYLLDVLMPGMKGLELCRLLREDWRLKDCTILVTSALGNLLPRDSVLAAGADDYIRKPFSMKQLIQQMEIWLERRRPGFPFLAFQRFGLDMERCQLLIGSRKTALSEVELALVKTLVFLPAKSWISRERVYSLLWASGTEVVPRQAESALADLKVKFFVAPPQEPILEVHPEKGIFFSPA